LFRVRKVLGHGGSTVSGRAARLGVAAPFVF
jgi:hypothetical protein